MAKRRRRTKTKRNRMAKSRKMARSRTKKLRKENKRGGAGGESVQAPVEFEHLLIKLLLASMGYNENGEPVYKDVDGVMVKQKLNIDIIEDLEKYIPPTMSIDNLNLLIEFAEQKNTEIQSMDQSGEMLLSSLSIYPRAELNLSDFKEKVKKIKHWMVALIKQLKLILDPFVGSSVSDDDDFQSL